MHRKIVGKVIRPAYPLEVSIGILLLVFAMSMFISHQIFEVHPDSLNEGKNTYLAAFLVSCAVVTMLLVLWEEFLFPIHVDLKGKEVLFNNHRHKLRKQLGIYFLIPVIFIYIYFSYAVNPVRFFIWAAICMIVPVIGKLVSGIKNYNDFLKFTDDTIQYKNNEKEGLFEIKNVKQIELIKDERNILHKIQLHMTNGDPVMIDLDEMEIEAFYNFINQYINEHYKDRVKETRPVVAQ